MLIEKETFLEKGDNVYAIVLNKSCSHIFPKYLRYDGNDEKGNPTFSYSYVEVAHGDMIGNGSCLLENHKPYKLDNNWKVIAILSQGIGNIKNRKLTEEDLASIKVTEIKEELPNQHQWQEQ